MGLLTGPNGGNECIKHSGKTIASFTYESISLAHAPLSRFYALSSHPQPHLGASPIPISAKYNSLVNLTRFGMGSVSSRYRDLSVRYRDRTVRYRFRIGSVSVRYRYGSIRYRSAIEIYRFGMGLLLESIGSVSVCIVTFSGSITSV